MIPPLLMDVQPHHRVSFDAYDEANSSALTCVLLLVPRLPRLSRR